MPQVKEDIRLRENSTGLAGKVCVDMEKGGIKRDLGNGKAWPQGKGSGNSIQRLYRITKGSDLPVPAMEHLESKVGLLHFESGIVGRNMIGIQLQKL